jgi:universal stress protein A
MRKNRAAALPVGRRSRNPAQLTEFRQDAKRRANSGRFSMSTAVAPFLADVVLQRRPLMILLKHILVATDFSEASDAALEYGRALAQTFGAALHVLHVAENRFLHPSAADPGRLEAATLRHLIERLTDHDRTALHAVVALKTSDKPAEEIVKYARMHGIDLIVMGTHGRGAMARLLVGSVAEMVVRTAPCPVLTVRSHERDFVVPDKPESTVNPSAGGPS